MDFKKQREIVNDFLTTKNYLILLLFLIAYYSYKMMWEIVFMLAVLFMVFYKIKMKLKRKMLLSEND